jgi:hypothetical protein
MIFIKCCMNLVYVCGVFIIYHENIIDISEIAEDIVLRDYLKNLSVF